MHHLLVREHRRRQAEAPTSGNPDDRDPRRLERTADCWHMLYQMWADSLLGVSLIRRAGSDLPRPIMQRGGAAWRGGRGDEQHQPQQRVRQAVRSRTTSETCILRANASPPSPSAISPLHLDWRAVIYLTVMWRSPFPSPPSHLDQQKNNLTDGNNGGLNVSRVRGDTYKKLFTQS